MTLKMAATAKGFLSKLKSDSSANSDVELVQAKLRIKVECIVLLYLLISFAFSGLSSHEFSTLCYLVGFMGIATVLYRSVHRKPGDYPNRKVFAVVLDTVAITFFMYRGGDTAAIMFPLYLWVTLGHGFRFGTKYLVLSQLANIGGFLFLCEYNAFWHGISAKSVFLATLIIIPLYAITLIKVLTSAAEKAREASEEKTRFVSNMSHEIRTPLHGIIGISELLGIRSYDEEYRGLCDSLSKSANVLLRLVNDVLDFAKIESGKLEITKRSFNLHALMEDTTRVFQGEALGKNIQIKLAIASGVQRQWLGDAQHIQQVLMNLIGNAIKFTQNGFINVTVDVATTEGEMSTLRFRVQDTGIGIPDKFQSRIFERFAQVKDANLTQYRGTGLGTAISKQLVEAMGGSISFTSKENVGSTFWFELPMQVSDLATSAAPEHANLSAWIANENVQYRGSLRILVAEDNETNQLIINKILEKSGFQFDMVSDGEEALDTLLSDEYDVALLDMQMPHLSGIEVCKAYKMIHSDNREIDFIMLSANVDQRERAKAMQVGFSECLPKPIESAKLLSLLDKKARSRSEMREMLAPSVSPSLQENRIETDFQLIDFSILRELASLSNDKNFLYEVVASFSSDVLKSIEAMEESLRDERYMEVQRHAHAMQGTASNVGVVAISKIGRDIEKMNPLQAAEQVPNLLVQARKLHAEAVQSLSESLAAITKGEEKNLIH
jgi:two-component system, sensor histidine kinase RpfC